MEDFKDHASVIAITKRNVLHHFTFKPVAEIYIRKILDNLNPRKAVGYDRGVPLGDTFHVKGLRFNG